MNAKEISEKEEELSREFDRYKRLCLIEEQAKKLMDQNKILGAKLAIAVEALNQIMKIGTTGEGNTRECLIAYETLGKLVSD